MPVAWPPPATFRSPPLEHVGMLSCASRKRGEGFLKRLGNKYQSPLHSSPRKPPALGVFGFEILKSVQPHSWESLRQALVGMPHPCRCPFGLVSCNHFQPNASISTWRACTLFSSPAGKGDCIVSDRCSDEGCFDGHPHMSLVLGCHPTCAPPRPFLAPSSQLR